MQFPDNDSLIHYLFLVHTALIFIRKIVAFIYLTFVNALRTTKSVSHTRSPLTLSLRKMGSKKSPYLTLHLLPSSLRKLGKGRRKDDLIPSSSYGSHLYSYFLYLISLIIFARKTQIIPPPSDKLSYNGGTTLFYLSTISCDYFH